MDPRERLRPGPIFRDIAVVFGLTFFGGCILGASGILNEANSGQAIWIIGAANFILGTCGFIFSGLLVPPSNRWRHLMWVALGDWLLGFMNVIMGVPILQWLVGVVVVAAMMGLGGLVGMALKPWQPPPPQ